MKDVTVLGLFGPAGSGKDLVSDWLVEQKGFIKLAYADPMKRFTQRTFNIGYNRLWGPSESRNEMFDVDDYWWAGAFRHFNEGGREIVYHVLPRERQTTGYLALIDWMQWLRLKYPQQISTRIILQTLGTEWGRHQDPNLWSHYAHTMINLVRRGHISYTQAGGPVTYKTFLPETPAGVVVPDHRFKNEIILMQESGGYVIRLRRLELEKKDEVIGIAGHQSEAEGKTIPNSVFDAVLEFEEGIDKVRNILEAAYEGEVWKAKSTVQETEKQELKPEYSLS